MTVQYKLTTLDDCPGNQSCQYEIDSQCQFVRVIRYCPYHRAQKDTGLSDEQVFADLCKTSKVRERARWIAKVALELDKEHPGVPFKIESDGTFTVGRDALNNLMSGWPTSGAKRTALIKSVMDEITLLEKSDKVRLA